MKNQNGLVIGSPLWFPMVDSIILKYSIYFDMWIERGFNLMYN